MKINVARIVRCAVCGMKTNVPYSLTRGFEDEDVQVYQKFCPSKAYIKTAVEEYTQQCNHCLYIARNLEEKIEERYKESVEDFVTSSYYKLPFGRDFVGDRDVLCCWRMGSLYAQRECMLLASQWFIYTGILFGELSEEYPDCQEYHMLRRKYLNRAVLAMKQELKKPHRKNDFELYLGYLNALRLAEMYDCVTVEQGIEEQFQCDTMDRKLLKKVVELAEKKDSTHMTYMEMLQG